MREWINAEEIADLVADQLMLERGSMSYVWEVDGKGVFVGITVVGGTPRGHKKADEPQSTGSRRTGGL